MKTILVDTSHNISIRYELATVMHRAVACGIDLTVLLVYLIFISFLIPDMQTSYYLFVLLIPGFYHLFWEVFFDGQSLGKKLLKIRVVTLEGRKPSLEDYFLRWIFRLIEVTFSLGILAAINIASTDKNQRIGDILAKTTVVKVAPESTVSLDTLKKLEHKERKIQYPAVTRYSDQDMLLVKETLERLRSNPNEANKQIGLKLAAKIADEINVEVKGSKAKFLENALIDYIFLTR